jgi:hypothetical protein
MQKKQLLCRDICITSIETEVEMDEIDLEKY